MSFFRNEYFRFYIVEYAYEIYTLNIDKKVNECNTEILGYSKVVFSSVYIKILEQKSVTIHQNTQ